MDELKTDFWASALIRRAQIAGAFDLWLIEVEDKHGRHFLEEPVDAGLGTRD